MKSLTPEFLKEVGDYMLVETPLAQADVCIVFGNMYCDPLAEKAAALYHQGYFKTIVATGAVLTDNGQSEAYRIRDMLISKGVPAEAILVENKSHNTGENVVMTMALLKEKVLFRQQAAVLAIGRVTASRRFLMTLERHWPSAAKMFTTAEAFGTPKQEWQKHPLYRQCVLQEYEKIAPYKVRGLIVEIDLEAMKRKIAALPKPSSSKPKPPAP